MIAAALSAFLPLSTATSTTATATGTISEATEGILENPVEFWVVKHSK
jgi:hypothetical protein